MKCYFTVLAVFASAAIGSTEAAEPDPLAAKKAAWQKTLEREPFRFSESNEGILSSLSQYGGNCQVHMIHDPAKWGGLGFKFVRDGKELLSLEGHTGSSFRTAGNVLYFAHFPRSSSGCTVTAHDLTTGNKLWETKLSGVGTPMHSAYSNRVTMGLSSLHNLDKKGEGIISITGRESYGDYVEILDRRTGKVLAHRIYRQGFGAAK